MRAGDMLMLKESGVGDGRKGKERKGSQWHERKENVMKEMMDEKGGLEKGGCLSSGQVQLTLNCLALELKHLNMPEGLEE